MFLDQYRLEKNPFASDRVRPVFRSQAYRYAATRIAQVLDSQLQCLFLSGPAGSGKSTLVDKELADSRGINIAWVKAGHDDPGKVLARLVKDIGPGNVEGNVSELRRILEVFLQHQTARGRRSLIVADGMEQSSQEVIREIESLSRLRWRSWPVVQVVFTTRNEDLVNEFLSQHHASNLARALHQRYSGFTLDETAAYVRGSLQGAGAEWADELIADDLLLDIQSFTQGVVADIDALCRECLDMLAERSLNAIRQPRLTSAMVKEAGIRLHLRYDPSAWKSLPEEVLSPDAVKQSQHDELRIQAARLLVTSGGHLVAEVSLNRPRMVLGRDGGCDISLDSSYVSRYQNLFMETTEGWMLIDLNSTNGCFVNGRKVHEHRLRDGDLITLGQHQLRFSGSSNDFSPRPRSDQDENDGTVRTKRF